MFKAKHAKHSSKPQSRKHSGKGPPVSYGLASMAWKGFSQEYIVRIFSKFIGFAITYNDVKIERSMVAKMHNQLTKQDIERMEEEIEYRKLVVRKEALEAVKEARAHGDLSENFEYYAAKREKNKNESRIRFLERMIKTAEIISDDSKEDEIGVNNTVDVCFEEDETVETYKIVTTMRGNSLEGLVSTESPIGKALLGHKVGDRVCVHVNDNFSYYIIVKRIEKTVDDGSDKIRSF